MMLKVMRQERDDLQKKLMLAKERLHDMDSLKKERTMLMSQKDE
jgi:hypothetical protein